MRIQILMFIILGVSALIVLGWLWPLIAGVRRYRRGQGGKVLIGMGAVWCLLAVSLVGMNLWVYFTWRQRAQVDAFDEAAYTGAVGSLALPYEGVGSLSFQHEHLDGKASNKRWHVVVTNGSVVVPAGRITADYLSVSLSSSEGVPAGQLTCSFSSDNRSFALEPMGLHRMPGGFPLVASIKAERQDEKLSLNFSMVDMAGNKVVWYAAGKNRKPPKFEAVAPSGKCFWRDEFEYG